MECGAQVEETEQFVDDDVAVEVFGKNSVDGVDRLNGVFEVAGDSVGDGADAGVGAVCLAASHAASSARFSSDAVLDGDVAHGVVD